MLALIAILGPKKVGDSAIASHSLIKVDVDCIENSDSLHRLRPINCATEMYTQLKALKEKATTKSATSGAA